MNNFILSICLLGALVFNPLLVFASSKEQDKKSREPNLAVKETIVILSKYKTQSDLLVYMEENGYFSDEDKEFIKQEKLKKPDLLPSISQDGSKIRFKGLPSIYDLDFSRLVEGVVLFNHKIVDINWDHFKKFMKHFQNLHLRKVPRTLFSLKVRMQQEACFRLFRPLLLES